VRVAVHRGMSPAARAHPLLRWSRNAFFLAGILILGYCGYVLVDAQIYQALQARHFQQEMNDLRRANPGDQKLLDLSFHPIPAGTLGKIEIPRIGLDAMIQEGIDTRTLRRAVGHVPGTPLPGQQGNVAIAGHRDTFFRSLRNVRRNDEITVTTLDGSYLYRVSSTEIVDPSDMKVLADSDANLLTLVTCYPFYFVGPAPKRFVVHAQKIPL